MQGGKGGLAPNFVGFDSGISHYFVMPPLPYFHLPKQNWSNSGKPIQGQQNTVSNHHAWSPCMCKNSKQCAEPPKATSFLFAPRPQEKLTKGIAHPFISSPSSIPEVDEAVAVAVPAVVGLLLDRFRRCIFRGGVVGGDETQFDHLVA